MTETWLLKGTWGGFGGWSVPVQPGAFVVVVVVVVGGGGGGGDDVVAFFVALLLLLFCCVVVVVARTLLQASSMGEKENKNKTEQLVSSWILT